jgi:hypothetical protein
LVLDFLYLVELLFLQDFILPQIFAQKVFVDLITPWILIVFVFRTSWKMFVLAAFAAFLLETHSGAPLGLFACMYWILGILLSYVRHHISWVSFLPWVVIFFISQVFVISFEGMAYWVQNFAPLSFLINAFFPKFLGLALSCVFGLFLIYHFRLDTLEEHRLARR